MTSTAYALIVALLAGGWALSYRLLRRRLDRDMRRQDPAAAVRSELQSVMMEINRATEQNVAIIEDRIDQLKSLMKDADKKIDLCKRILAGEAETPAEWQGKDIAKVKREWEIKKSVFNGRQLAIKIVCNSVYGFLKANMVTDKDLMSAVTDWGRWMIGVSKEVAETHFTKKNGYEHDAYVVYGDTVRHSFLFVRYGGRNRPTLTFFPKGFNYGQLWTRLTGEMHRTGQGMLSHVYRPFCGTQPAGV